MKLRFETINGRAYFVDSAKYVLNLRLCVSQFQFRWKKFFHLWMPDDLWYEEFPVRPHKDSRFRIDLLNLTRRFAVECHGDQHVKVSDYFHGGDQSVFYTHLSRDRLKELWCEHNKIKHISVYTTTKFDRDYFISKYPTIKWK